MRETSLLIGPTILRQNYGDEVRSTEAGLAQPGTSTADEFYTRLDVGAGRVADASLVRCAKNHEPGDGRGSLGEKMQRDLTGADISMLNIFD
jgi:hypothetical protein